MSTYTSVLITTKEVAHRLGVTEQTIYSYINKEQLIPVNREDWVIDGTYYFDEEYIEGKKDQFIKPGLSTKEVAEQLEVTINTVTKYITTGKLKAMQKEYRGKLRYFVQPEEVEAFLQTVSKTNKKQLVYSTTYGYHLFQPFIHTETGEFARITLLESRKIGAATTDTGKEIPLSALKEQGYRSAIEVKKKKPITKRGYAAFAFPKPQHVKSPIYKAIDLLFVQAGPQNIKVAIEEEKIRVSVKPLLLTVSQKDYVDEVDMLMNYLVEGRFSNRPNGLLIDSDLESLHTFVPRKLKEEIVCKAKEKGLSNEDYVLKLIEIGWRESKNG